MFGGIFKIRPLGFYDMNKHLSVIAISAIVTGIVILAKEHKHGWPLLCSSRE